MNILIIGHGRAGKRHTELVHYLGHTPVLYDPKKYYDFALQADPAEEIEILYLDKNSRGLRGILTKYTFDLAVICTPPDLHLSQARTCLEAGLHVLIEKPLCGWDQLGEAKELLAHRNSDRAMMAFNYRWHPVIKAIKETGDNDDNWPGVWQAHSEQYRPGLPGWGILLDHAAHTVDIFRHLSGRELEPTFASQDSAGKFGVSGKLVGSQSTFLMSDWADRPGEKVAWVKGPFGRVDVPTTHWEASEMFGGMWRDVLAWVRGEMENPCPLVEGYKAQVVLEKARALL